MSTKDYCASCGGDPMPMYDLCADCAYDLRLLPAYDEGADCA